MGELIGYIEVLLTALSPIIAAFFAYKTAVTEKETKKYVELREKYEKEMQSKREAAEAAQSKAIADMQADVKQLRKEMADWQKTINMNDVDSKLDCLLKVSKLNFDYSQSLSSVIAAIGDVVEKAEVGDVDTIREEIKRHKKEEMSIHSSLIKLIN